MPATPQIASTLVQTRGAVDEPERWGGRGNASFLEEERDYQYSRREKTKYTSVIKWVFKVIASHPGSFLPT